jgi:Tfp pilus assembly PilM family ATPase
MTNTVGIDIAFEAVKVAGLKLTGKSYQLVGLNYTPSPKDCWTSEELKNRDELAKIIQDSLRTAKPNGIPGHHAMVALPESVVYSSFFALPNIPKKDLAQALPFEIADRMSINPDEYIIDYEITKSYCQPTMIATSLKSGANKEKAETKEAVPDKKDQETELAANQIANDGRATTVLAVAAKKTLVDSIIELCDLAKLELAGIDIKAASIARALISGNDGKMRIVVDLGANTTGVTVAEGHSPRLISSIPIGTESYLTEGSDDLSKFRQTGAPIFDELVHVTKFFENRICPGAKIENIVITGGGSNVASIADFFQKETGLKAVIGDAFSQVDTHHFPIPEKMAHKFADAIGLAMRKISSVQ